MAITIFIGPILARPETGFEDLQFKGHASAVQAQISLNHGFARQHRSESVQYCLKIVQKKN
jgi:hypothetical protein